MKKNKKKMIILGIETSCDETSAAVVRIANYGLRITDCEILSNIVFSQIAIHKKYGGIVPEVAARNHVKNIIPVIDLAFKKARVTPKDIDRIAVTYGPGLITSLMVGVEAARNLAYAWKKQIIAVDHIKGHIYAAWLASQEFPISNFQFPILVLVVSGGHTELLLMKNVKSFKKVGQTLDDAAGEAFDKVAKMLELGFPGGPAISKLAEKGNPQAFDFPRPMIHSKDFNFSFSGLKTAVLYKNKESRIKNKEYINNIAASFQQAVVDVLAHKTIKAAEKYKVKTLILGGGVAANKLLRETMRQETKRLGIPFIVPEIKLCTDNAAPIAVAGFFGKEILWKKLRVDPQLEIE